MSEAMEVYFHQLRILKFCSLLFPQSQEHRLHRIHFARA
jgi:hypothetical protein